jgi:hypothetical protein
MYLICLGINYVPMLALPIGIARKRSARAELGDEVNDKPGVMAQYRRPACC